MSGTPCDLLVVGAGPAGMAAAIEAARAGLAVTVVDEGGGPGGQIYRGILDGDTAWRERLGADYAAGRPLAEAFMAARVERHFRTSAVMIERQPEGFAVALSGGGQAQLVATRTIVIAAGALERPFPVEGWTLPGVMTAGAAQTLLKANALVPEGPLVLAGTGPLLLLLAAQLARLGVRPEALLDTTPASNWRAGLPHLPAFLAGPSFAKGLGLLREARKATPIIRGVTALAAEGDGRLAAVSFTANGRERRMVARALLLHQGVAPQLNLAMASGVAYRWREERLAFEPHLSRTGESAIPGLFLAGDCAGVAGAEAARLSGARAARAIASRLGRTVAPDGLEAQHRRALRGRRFIDALYRPAAGFRSPADDVVVCRCEEVTAGEIRRIARAGAQGPNQAKAMSRAGMGPCQGRLCGLTVAEIMADERGLSPGDIGHYRLRPPVKPMTLGEIAMLVEPEN
jgi:NADPH-dependent 2,4-dienoyl-CoA reductase/sulfur reductase-like enzyme